MEVSHEVPSSFLQESLKFNDYDYALVHLFKNYPSYFNFFKKNLKKGRKVILDNSLYELGSSFKASDFAYYIEILNPTYYVTPDVWACGTENIESFKRFNYTFNSKKIGVVQGQDLNDLIDNYKFMSEHADKIALTFGLPVYETLGWGKNKSEKLMTGRFYFLNYLNKEGIINTNKPHHLLGCALPQEFLYYKKFTFIESIDTSNPIVAGIKGQLYSREGLKEKPTEKLIDFFDITLSEAQKKCILYNVSVFKEFLK